MGSIKRNADRTRSSIEPEVVVKRWVARSARQETPQRDSTVPPFVERQPAVPDPLELQKEQRGRRPVRKGVAFENLIAGVVGGNRMSILVVLARRPHFVSEVQRLLGAKYPSHVTEELQLLLSLGIVTWESSGSRHVYRLTNFLRVFRRRGMVQFVLPTPAGHWAVLHFDEGTKGIRVMPPPSDFIDTKLKRTPR